MIKITLLIIFCIAIYLFTPFIRNGGDTISCKSDVAYHWKQDRLDLLTTQTLHGGKGVLSMSGILYEKDKTKAYLSKTVSFSYLQNSFFYYFRSELVIDSPQMTMSLSDQKKWLPEFFTENNMPLVLKIRPYGKDAWVFYSENTPLFICERSN
ncbi:hypothetical protein [Erwinia piriflorinigrans]|uniref:Uncharacterized protein n=1 Tax=Erwinia piriflorinigrans CFBP 5888 TaxID=1161919 RepID=V5Z437_9GAMM|nr:hypothetical protein [Erwinia piriflorinigrans]CCG85774.1 hypothetical protein EPIR_0409 [Erwinia piriflorinigrans CFBP 5888]